MANTANSKTKPWLSLSALHIRYLRRCFTAAGLTNQKSEIDGGDTIVQYWCPSSASSKPALVFIHGFGPEAIWQWRRQMAFFSSEFAVYVPNLVFFGESTTTRASSKERSEVFQAEVVVKLMEKLGVERYSVVGTSYGGFVAYRMALMWPERVERVVIASSAVNIKGKDNGELLKRAKMETIEELMLPTTAKQLRTLIGLATFRGSTNFMPDFFLNDIINTLYVDKRKEKMELLKGVTFGRDDNVCLSALQQDVLILWGEHDQIFPLEKAIELKKILGKKVRLEVIKKTAHVPHVEDADQFNNIVKKFLSGTF